METVLFEQVPLKHCKVDRHNKDVQGVNVLQSVITNFTRAVNLNTCRFVMKSRKYKERVFGKIVKWAEQMDVKMRSEYFKIFDPISALSFLDDLKTDCDRNEIHEGAAMWLIRHNKKDPTETASAHKVCSIKQNEPQQKEKLTTYCQGHNHLLATYPSDHVIAALKGYKTNFKPLEGMSQYIAQKWYEKRHYAVIVSKLNHFLMELSSKYYTNQIVLQ